MNDSKKTLNEKKQPKNWWEYTSSSTEFNRGHEWDMYELWNLSGMRLVDELMRYSGNSFPTADFKENVLYQALSQILRFDILINRKLRKLLNEGRIMNDDERLAKAKSRVIESMPKIFF